MITIGIDPVVFTIRSHEIRWYGIMVALGVVSLLVIMAREAKRLNIPRDIYSIFLCGIIGGIVGGRLAYVIYYWEQFMADPRSIIGLKGTAQMGMIVGIVVAALIYMGVTRMSFSMLLRMGDAFIAGAALALAIGRIGCFLNGCCHGVAAPDLPWAVVYTHPRSAALLRNTPVHPTQLYHTLWNLIVFGLVWRFRRKFKPEGSLVFFGFCIYAAGDLALRFLRYDRPSAAILFWGLDNPQVVDFAFLVIFLPWLIFKMYRFQRQTVQTQPASVTQPEQSPGG